MRAISSASPRRSFSRSNCRCSGELSRRSEAGGSIARTCFAYYLSMTSRDNSIIEALERRQLLSGVTIITHGQGGDAGGAVKQTADLIAERAGGATQYVMTVADKNGKV